MNHKHRETSSSVTEAWADHDHYDPETNVGIPSEEAVVVSKEWVESNEL